MKIEKVLGLEPLSEFPELDAEWVDQELNSVEDVQLAQDEWNEMSGGGLVDEEQMSPEERAEYEQLRKEEKEAELDALGIDGSESETEQGETDDWF